MSAADEIREALQSLPQLPATATGNAPSLDEIYYPDYHVTALDPDVSLVVGNRGMGKSFWANALNSPPARAEIAVRYSTVRAMSLDRVVVDFGFASGEGAVGQISRDDIAGIRAKISTDSIWRAVITRVIAKHLQIDIPHDFRSLVQWVESDADQHRAIFRQADQIMAGNNKKLLILFDQLEQMADDWKRIQALTQGLLKTCLAMKSYNSIRLKVFMRPDQFEDDSLFRFQDAAKIKGDVSTLKWRVADLYGLLFSTVFRKSGVGGGLRDYFIANGVSMENIHPRLKLPKAVVGDEHMQAAVFDMIAGNAMGRGKKRGRPYSWIASHLADGRGEISPRTFFITVREAAYHSDPTPINTAIDFHGIQEGVRVASQNRLNELLEDYPWVSEALQPLRGLVVPCERSEIYRIWKIDGTISRIIRIYNDVKAPIDLVFADLLGDGDEETNRALIKVLREIGVVEVRENEKINVPDIFRVRAGILRKGGIAPQQRRLL